MALINVPPEMLSEILGFLDAKGIIVCSSVCRLWHETVKSSPALQYTIELWASGMNRGDSGPLTSSETLEALHERRRAWRHLEWKSETIAEIYSLKVCRAYELVGGVFVQQMGSDFLAISFSDTLDALGNSTATHPIQTSYLHGFGIDPTQDLVAFLYMPAGESARLEFRTISTMEPHPLASVPIHSFMLDANIELELSIQIADDMIATFVPASPYLLIFNWRAGITILEAEKEPELSCHIKDLQFLSSRSFIVAFEGDRSGQIDIFTLGKTEPAQVHVATLQLPQLAPGGFISSMKILAAPLCAKSIAGTPFSQSNENRIYMFMICYCDDQWFRLFVHHQWLQKYIRDHSGRKTTPTVVPWEEWGPLNSRMLPGKEYQCKRHLSGTRVAFPTETRQSVQILDFGIIPGRIDPTDEAHPSAVLGFNTEVHLNQSVSEMAGTVFQNIVTTSLPYWSTVRSLDKEFDIFLIDQDRIIGVDLSDLNSKQQMIVYTF
ncbi:hypothetical protein B0H13DRAFT_2491327 [Mycena leptocephala]|nr:hypothetical protein B0H13DRAFT_2491327 [Mycena leptocephala]